MSRCQRRHRVRKGANARATSPLKRLHLVSPLFEVSIGFLRGGWIVTTGSSSQIDPLVLKAIDELTAAPALDDQPPDGITLKQWLRFKLQFATPYHFGPPDGILR